MVDVAQMAAQRQLNNNSDMHSSHYGMFKHLTAQKTSQAKMAASGITSRNGAQSFHTIGGSAKEATSSVPNGDMKVEDA
jgi:hypothetical protein